MTPPKLVSLVLLFAFATCRLHGPHDNSVDVEVSPIDDIRRRFVALNGTTMPPLTSRIGEQTEPHNVTVVTPNATGTATAPTQGVSPAPTPSPTAGEHTRSITVIVDPSDDGTGDPTPTTPTSTDATPPPPPPPPDTSIGSNRTDAAAARHSEELLASVMTSSAAQGVMIAAHAAALVSGVLLPTSATKAANMMSIGSLADCTEGPARLEMPWYAVGPVWDFGGSRHASHLGTALGIAGLLIVVTVGFVVAAAFATPIVAWLAALVALTLVGYFCPTVASIVTGVFLYGALDDTIAGGLLYGVSASTVCVLTVPLVMAKPTLLRRVRHEASVPTRSETIASSASNEGTATLLSKMVNGLGMLLVQANPGLSRLIVLFFFEDVVISILLGTLAGVRPTSEEGCFLTALAMAAAAAFHVAYVLVVAPFAVPLDRWLSVVVAVLQLGFATTVTVASQQPAASEAVPWVTVSMAGFVMLHTFATLVDRAVQRCRSPDETLVHELPEVEKHLVAPTRRHAHQVSAVGHQPNPRGAPVLSMLDGGDVRPRPGCHAFDDHQDPFTAMPMNFPARAPDAAEQDEIVALTATALAQTKRSCEQTRSNFLELQQRAASLRRCWQSDPAVVTETEWRSAKAACDAAAEDLALVMERVAVLESQLQLERGRALL